MSRWELTRGDTGFLSRNGMAQFRRCEEALLAEILARLHHESQKLIPRNLGISAKSWLPSVDIERDKFGLHGKISSPLKQMPVLEYGRKPGGKMPPDDRTQELELRPIAWWVHLKLGVPVDQQRIGKPGDGDYQPSFEDVVFLVRRGIARNGFADPHKEGWRFVRDTIETHRAWCMQRWSAGIPECLAGSETQSSGSVPAGEWSPGAGDVPDGHGSVSSGDLSPGLS